MTNGILCSEPKNVGSLLVWLSVKTYSHVLRVREVPGSIPSQGPRHTKDVIKMVPVVPLFSTEHSKGGNTGSFSRIKIGK